MGWSFRLDWSRLFLDRRPTISEEELRKIATRRLWRYIAENRSDPDICPICSRFLQGRPLTEQEQLHVEEELQYQMNRILKETGRRMVPALSGPAPEDQNTPVPSA